MAGGIIAPVKTLDVQTLSCLMTLVEEAHVTRAAQRMGVGQPAMSETLSRLRRVFGDPLLVRVRGGMAATPRALEAAAMARQVLELIERAVPGRGDFDASRTRVTFHLVALNSLSFFLLPKIIKRIEAEAPQFRVLVQPGDMRLTRELLEANECDMVMGFPPRVASSLHAMPLMRLGLCCIARQGHPDIDGRLSLAQFVRHPHVVLGAGAVPVSAIESTVERSLRQRHVMRRVGVRVPDLLITPAVVAETDFLATVPKRLADAFATSLGLQILKLPFTFSDPNVLLVWHERSHRDSAHRWLRHVVRDIARSLKPEEP
jgi:LysR family transcriptional regulator, mexEF-oprN operon transcriptional activator